MTDENRNEPSGKSGADATEPAMPLAAASPGDEVKLVSVEGGHRLLYRLAEMGIRPGVRFRVLSRGRPGPFIIMVGQVRLVLGQGMVHRILVKPVHRQAGV